MAEIYLENLPEEYRRKLRTRELTRETIDRLAVSVSADYMLRKRTFRKIIVLLPVMTVFLAILSFFAPAAREKDPAEILRPFAFVILAEILIAAAVYYLTVIRIPKQFARCLKEGYPELESEYGYEQLVSGSLTADQETRQPSFSMRIENVFELKDSEDVVAAGFAHGLIEKGNSVCIAEQGDAAKKRGFAIVAAVEKAGGKAAVQAADCRAALRIQKGKRLGLAPGMFLYRE